MERTNITTLGIEDQLNKPPYDSKKWRMTIIGAQTLGGVFIVSHVMIFLKPDLAVHLANMMQISMYSLASIFSLYLGAQGFTDFRNSATLATVNTNEVKKQEIESHEEKTVNIVHNIDVDSTVIGNQKDDDFMIEEVIREDNELIN